MNQDDNGITKLGCVNHDCDKCKAQQQQEPVAYMDVSEKGQMSDLRFWSEPNNRHQVPLYTSPPASKQWVGLTEDEIDFLELKYAPPIHPDFETDADHCYVLIKKTEAKLKEKNA